ncbi:MAG: RNHCP domain-containing protein [Candidatus Woesearchaeota archaeon]
MKIKRDEKDYEESNYRKKYREDPKKDFRCGYCKNMVPAESIGTAHRNHCPTCGYSRHIDNRTGHVNSTCKSLMAPVGLMWKSEGEISLVHLCLGCETIDYNRIAGDDNPEMILGIYQASANIEDKLVGLLSAQRITLILPEEEYMVRVRLFGQGDY